MRALAVFVLLVGLAGSALAGEAPASVVAESIDPTSSGSGSSSAPAPATPVEVASTAARRPVEMVPDPEVRRRVMMLMMMRDAAAGGLVAALLRQAE